MSEAIKQTTGAEDILWNLDELYTSTTDPSIERDLTDANEWAEQFAAHYRGHVASLSATELAEALTQAEKIYELIGRLNSFASLQWETATDNAAYGALLQRIREATSQLNQKLLFFELEWAVVPEDHAHMIADPLLARWRYYLERTIEQRPHLLSEPEEKILEEKRVTGIAAWQRFYGQTFAAVRYEFDGETLTQEQVLKNLYSPDRELRRKAADSLTVGLRQTLPSATYIFNVTLADKASNDRLRKYPTWISSRNQANQTTDEAVEALVKAVTSRYDIVARYYHLKRQLLDYDTLYDYDRYAPVTTTESQRHWLEAKDIVLTAFNAFHPQMSRIAAEFFDQRWIHAPITPGKRGGAFASPTVPSHHPYVFVNYAGTNKDVMTLAHELGHGVHMYLSRPKGVFEAYTPLTTAETASVFAEMLVFNDLMSRESDPRVRLTMLASKIEDTFATVFRQVSMNRFEDVIHTTRRTKGELTPEQFSDAWMETQRVMFGDSVSLRDEYGIWWSYVQHFIIVPGYVYAYAFGELLVMALVAEYQRQGAAFAPVYLDILSAGGSERPEKIMAKAGIDLTNPGFWQQGLDTIEQMVVQLEGLIAEVKALPKT